MVHKNRKGILIFTALILISTITILATSGLTIESDTELSWLSVSGNIIKDEYNTTIILRGVNIENREWIWEHNKSIDFEKRVITELGKNWNINAITIAFASGPINRNDEIYLNQLDEIVKLAKKHKIYTILSYRYTEPNTNQPSMPNQAAEDAFIKLATRYSNESSVLYSLQVEPHDVTWSQLKPRFTSMIDSIRTKNSKAIVIVPGTQWSRYIHWSLTDPIDRPNLIYKTHPYDSWTSIQNKYQLDRISSKFPILLGEFGTGSMMTQSDVDNLLNYSEQKGISWQAWLMNKAGCPCLITDNNTLTTTPYGEKIKQRLNRVSIPKTEPYIEFPVESTSIVTQEIEYYKSQIQELQQENEILKEKLKGYEKINKPEVAVATPTRRIYLSGSQRIRQLP